MAFQKGRSGNPGGRPKMPAELRDLCRRQSDLAVETLIDICRDKDAPANAANLLLTRAWGPAAMAGEGAPRKDRAVRGIDGMRGSLSPIPSPLAGEGEEGRGQPAIAAKIPSILSGLSHGATRARHSPPYPQGRGDKIALGEEPFSVSRGDKKREKIRNANLSPRVADSSPDSPA